MPTMLFSRVHSMNLFRSHAVDPSDGQDHDPVLHNWYHRMQLVNFPLHGETTLVFWQ